MIRIDRGAEPNALASARATHLPAAVAAFNAHGGPSQALSDKLTGYSVKPVKETLYARQNRKCAYCERRTDFSSHHVEHFRPKDGAWRHERGQPAKVDQGHYWWLTWTWENLLFSCVRCNDRGHKANYFQVRPGTACAAPAAPIPTSPADLVATVAGEAALFIDPAGSIDPITLLWWEPSTHNAQGRAIPPRLWTWSPRWTDDRGRVTADNLKLLELAADIQRHITRDILPRVEKVRQAALAGQRCTAKEDWDALLRDKLDDLEESFRGPTWKALELLVSAAERTEWGLTAPRRP
jgi:hypothetical protein